MQVFQACLKYHSRVYYSILLSACSQWLVSQFVTLFVQATCCLPGDQVIEMILGVCAVPAINDIINLRYYVT